MRLKKLIVYLMLVFFIFNYTPFQITFAEEAALDLLAPSALLLEETSGKVLFEKNSHEQRSCASITKIMTMILVMDAINTRKISLSDTVIASEHAASMGGSDIWLELGEAMSVDELIRAVMVASANDAAVALAEFVCGSEEAFVAKMNEKAQSLSMKDTFFKNCNGLDEEGHVSSAHDIAIMSRELMRHKEIFNYTSIWIDYLRDGKTQLVNTNKLLKSYKGITGLKTGTTSGAGCCISATAKRENLSLIAVVLGDKNGKDRFRDAATLLDFGFANYTMMTPLFDESILNPMKVNKGMEANVPLKVKSLGNILVKKGEEKSITNALEVATECEAPIEEDRVFGYIIYKSGEEEIARFPIVSTNSIEKIKFSLVLKKLLKTFLKL